MNKMATLKVAFFHLLVIMFSCQSNLTDREKLFVGAWKHNIGTKMNPDSTFGYLELRPDRKGKNGIVVAIKGKISHAPGLTYDVTNWSLKHDTLVVEYLMTGGLFSGPGRRDTLVNDFPVTDFWILKGVNGDGFFAENYTPGIPFTSQQKFIRTEVIE